MNAARLFPFLNELRHYSLRDFRADFVAALTVTPMAVPQAMAYALIAGVHPQYGIYACMLPVIVAALWGSARYLAAGPTNAISMVLFTTMSTVSIGGITVASLPEEARMPYIFGIALLCGLIQVGMGLARLGELANFISHSVMVAFSAGAALLIASGQLKTALGLPSSQAQGFFPQIDHVIHNFTHLNIWCLLVSGGTILLILLFKRISRRFPATLAALVIISAVSALLGLHEQGVRLVGAIPSVVPPLSLPPAFDMASIRDLFMPALAIALLGAVESLAIGKQLAGIRGDRFDGSQELIGQGLGNIAAGLTSGIPGCGSFTRSALVVTSGGRSRMGTVFSGLLALPMLFVMAPLVSWLPMPALAGVLLLISVNMIDIPAIRLCLRATDPLMRYAPDNMPEGLVVYVIEGTLFFGAIHELERQLYEEDDTPPRLVVLHLTRVFWLDASGAHALEQFLERCYARSVPVVLVVGSRNVRDILGRTGVIDCLSDGFVADTLGDGLRIGVDMLNRHICCHTGCPEESCPGPACPTAAAPRSVDQLAQQRLQQMQPEDPASRTTEH